MRGVVITGSSGALGRRVAASLTASESPWRVVGLDASAPVGLGHPSITEHRVDLLRDDLAPHFEGAEVVVHLASVFAPSGRRGRGGDVELTRRVLDAARLAGVRSAVVMSSATVYGAWPDNPIPLTEDVPLHPNEGFAFAQDKVAVERLVAELRGSAPDVSVAVLRPTVALAEDTRSWLASALAEAARIRAGDVDPPSQFLHFDDLAAAVVVAVEERLDGVYNVAPDGWIPPDSMRALVGLPRLRVPVAVADRLARLRWSLGLTRTPAEILPLTLHPWVVANDRLRVHGWAPGYTNEEAYVAGTAAGPLSTLSPKRRQEIALAATGGVVLALGAMVVLALRRRSRHSRSARTTRAWRSMPSRR